jgi:hypothetical protein
MPRGGYTYVSSIRRSEARQRFCPSPWAAPWRCHARFRVGRILLGCPVAGLEGIRVSVFHATRTTGPPGSRTPTAKRPSALRAAHATLAPCPAGPSLPHIASATPGRAPTAQRHAPFSDSFLPSRRPAAPARTPTAEARSPGCGCSRSPPHICCRQARLRRPLGPRTHGARRHGTTRLNRVKKRDRACGGRR